ncbi:cytochrome P450 [Cladorrhinum sp. PSN259]|nr:cytochrome P450 [Cladorrhinum sp. PSN259]
MDLQYTLLLSLVEAVSFAFYQQSQILPGSILPNLFLLFAIQYAAIKSYRIFIWPRLFSPLRHIPGPKSPFYSPLGQMPAILASDSPIDTYLSWARMWPTFPFIRFLSLFNSEMLLAVTPEAYKELLTTHCYEFKKPALLSRLVEHVIGHRGVIFIEGEPHKAARKRLKPLFSGTSIKRLLPLFQKKAEEMTRWFEKGLDQSGVATFDIGPVYSKMTIDVIGVAVLGVELENLSSTDESQKRWDFLPCYAVLFEQSPLSALLTFIDMAVPIRWIPLKANRDFVGAGAQIRKMTAEVIQNRVQEVNEKAQSGTASGGNDLLTMMIEDMYNLEGEEGLGQDYIVDEMLTFLLAGHETSASALLWATYAMATKPAIQDKLRAEILTLFEASDPNNKTPPTMAQIESLPYLDCFLKEILRVYSPSIFGYREALNDLYLCGEFIPKGTVIMYSPHITCLSETVWGPTAGEFIPERWEKAKGPTSDPYTTNYFLNGPRVCIGKQFAWVEIKTLLIELVPKFRFAMSPDLKALGGKLPKMMNPSVSYRPREKLNVIFERI